MVGAGALGGVEVALAVAELEDDGVGEEFVGEDAGRGVAGLVGVAHTVGTSELFRVPFTLLPNLHAGRPFQPSLGTLMDVSQALARAGCVGRFAHRSLHASSLAQSRSS